MFWCMRRAQVVPHDAQIESKGKTITRKGDEENPAVKVQNGVKFSGIVSCAHVHCLALPVPFGTLHLINFGLSTSDAFAFSRLVGLTAATL